MSEAGSPQGGTVGDVSGAPSFRLRRPTVEDAAAIAAVQVDGWRDTYGRLLPQRFYDAKALAERTRTWSEALSRPDRAPRLFVAESAAPLVGFAFASSPREEHPARDLQLHMLYVRTPLHGSGIGQALLDAVLEEEPAQLWCAKENLRALAFYRRNGFTPDGTEKVDTDFGDLTEVRLVR